MLYSRMMVSGYVMKKVQNQNAGLLQIQFHKRKLVLDFDIFPSLTIGIGENKLVEKKDIALEDIQRVSIKDVKQAREIRRRDKKERPKPVGSMDKFFTKVSDTFKPKEFDIYEHAFEIQMPKRSYLFYTETEIESKRWVRVLSLLVSMK